MPEKLSDMSPDFVEQAAFIVIKWFLEEEVELKRFVDINSVRKLKQIKSIVKNDRLSDRERIELIETIFLGLSLP